jgi:hypothetical protein
VSFQEVLGCKGVGRAVRAAALGAILLWAGEAAATPTPAAGFEPVDDSVANEAAPPAGPDGKTSPATSDGAAGASGPPAGSAASAPPAAGSPGGSPTGAPNTTPAKGAPTGGPTPAAAAPPVDGATYAVRLRDLEARVDELKEQIRRSHTRLSLLSETVLGGGLGGARAEITLVNELSGAFKVVGVLIVLDGAVQFNKQDDKDALEGQTEVPVFTGSIPAGDHTVQVLLKLKGHGYGVFSYLRGYSLEPKNSHAFTVTEGKTVQLKIIAWEKGGVTTPLEQRPDIRYVETLRAGSEPSSRGASSPRRGGS